MTGVSSLRAPRNAHSERAPRIRFGKVHLYNDLWTSSGDDYCIGVDVGANVRSEENAVISVKTPIDTTAFLGKLAPRPRGSSY
jgi:pectate lyase